MRNFFISALLIVTGIFSLYGCGGDEIQKKDDDKNMTIEGIWKRSYSEIFKPLIQPDAVGADISYDYTYNIHAAFSGKAYKFTVKETEKKSGKVKTDVFEGTYTAVQDTLRLFKDKKLFKEYSYVVAGDTLTLSLIPGSSTAVKHQPAPDDVRNEIRFEGKYAR